MQELVRRAKAGQIFGRQLIVTALHKIFPAMRIELVADNRMPDMRKMSTNLMLAAGLQP